MKRIRLIYSLLIGLLVLTVSSCDSIVDEKHLENSTDVAGVELTVTQNSSKGNLLVLSMNTLGVTGYWDYNLGKALTNKVEIVYPIPGKSTFTFIGTLGAEFFEKTIDVQIDVLDTPLDQDWYDLVSTNTSAGKTWVFDGGPTPDGKLWWFMSDPNNNPWGLWWNAAGDCCPPADAAGKMVFDLNGAANYTYYSGPGATPKKGTFVLDVKNQTLLIEGANLLGSMDGGGNAGIFRIVELTQNRMVLYVPNAAWATGWTWVFKPQS